MASDFTEDQIERYSRHIILPEVGSEGQKKISEAKVFMVGAGGLGSPCGYYLAAAGVGTIGIADNDVVEISNLQRQIIHSTSRVGHLKVRSAKQTIEDLNPDVHVVPHKERLTSENALDLVNDYDIVVDASDNFPTRYLMNDACVLLKKPLVHGSVFKFEGLATVVIPREGPCYRCAFEGPPPPEVVPPPSETGLLGVIPGVIGVIQATEVLKLIVGAGDPLVGKLLIYDGLAMNFRKVDVSRNPGCVVCGDNPTITELIDYDEFCSMQ